MRIKLDIFVLLMVLGGVNASHTNFSQRLSAFLPAQDLLMSAKASNLKTNEVRYIDYEVTVNDKTVITSFTLKKRPASKGIRLEQVSSREEDEVKTSLILPPTNFRKALKDRTYAFLGHDFEPALLSFYWLENLDLVSVNEACVTDDCIVYMGTDSDRNVRVEFSTDFVHIVYVAVSGNSDKQMQAYFSNYRVCETLYMPHTILLKDIDAGDLQIDLACMDK